MNTAKQQIPEEIFNQQPKPTAETATDAGVGQDKTALMRDRTALSQAAPRTSPPRSVGSHSGSKRTTLVDKRKKRTVELSLWVDPVVKDELTRRAKRSGLSISATGGALLKRSLQQSIDMEYGALLEPIIRQEIRRQIRGFASRIALLLVRVAFAAEQTRALVTNILGRQPGVEQDVLTNILDSSANAAKGKITRKTPQLQRILAEVEAWFTGDEDAKGGK